MKTEKEIQLAASAFSSAFDNNQATTLEGTFIPYQYAYLYKKQQFYLGASVLIGVLFCYLAYHAWYTDAVYYWHIDGPVVTGITIIALFLVTFLFLVRQYFQIGLYINDALKNPRQSRYGTLITKEYYFENNPREFHIIPKENIVRIDHEEKRKNQEIYLELLLDMGNRYELRGITYHPTDFDLKAWIEQDK
ncbi:hypothetical protein [Aureispira sp. CCB-E]|uniref:hypothetical protein n=1 Tax=Aureispira sp. CCB-E TaxID=3051121 RepID=UPI0028689888|nr:hypothetical protein [Aureispira sp. CCB-E]WMX16405.1 hypothetical protein QP953_08500 [Aureispira sp. CCB-E]